ncbi:MAG TPA: hypothetical protein VGM98_25125 [Schlesneria sp.]
MDSPEFDDELDGERGHRLIDAGDVVSTSWEIFKVDYGIVIGGTVLSGFLMQIFAQVQNVFNIIGQTLRNQGDEITGSILIIIGFCWIPISFCVQTFLQVGQAQLLLNVARGDRAQISDLFSGGRYFWRMLGATLLFSIMIGLGTLACIIPGIILAMMFFSYAYALVDENPPGVECLSRARAAAKDNLGAILVIFLATVGINILGALMLCVGLLATFPLTTLMLAVTYCKMTGQRTVSTLIDAE